MRARIVFLVLIALVAWQGVVAQDDAVARVRVANLIMDTIPLQGFYNSNPVDAPVEPGVFTDYIEVEPRRYIVRFAPVGAPATEALTEVLLEAEAGHDYTIYLVGSQANGDALAALLDETAAFGSLDLDAGSLVTFFHNLAGAPPIDIQIDGETVVEDLDYGQLTAAVLPPGMIRQVVVTAADDPDAVLMAPPFDFGELTPELSWALGPIGSFPGAPGLDFFLMVWPTFTGELTTTEGEALEPGVTVSGEIARGQRVSHALTLDADATLSVTLSAPPESALDAYLRVYDSSGMLVAENDELSFEDEGLDAGLSDLDLQAGSYTVVAGSWNDALPGAYELLVEAAAN